MQNEPQVDFDSPDQNQLAVIVQESNLPQSKAKYILEKFQDYFNFADELTKTTQQIKVTDASQTHLMDMARAARLTIRERRIAVEKAHKEIKADVLREGRAIDGIKNVLLALLEPLEVYYDKQENFVKYQEAEKAELIRLEVEKRIEEEMVEAAKAKAIEDQRIREENETLKEKAYQVELERRKEREEAEKKAQVERLEQENKIADIKRASEAKFAQERAEKEAVERELRAKKEAEQRAADEAAEEEIRRINLIEAKAKAGDMDKLTDLIIAINAVQMPEVKSEESKRAVYLVSKMMVESIKVLNQCIIKDQDVDF